MTVYFIGAGPGDPELITVKGQRLIRECPVVLYAGSLVPEALIRSANPTAAIANTAEMHLDEIIDRIQTAHEQWLDVARVHSGDPSIYSAIGEQIRRLEPLGIPYEVIPGVTSAMASAAALGRELTLPGITQTVILTRYAGKTPVPERESLAELARHRATLVIYLSIQYIDEIVAQLLPHYGPECPVAVMYRTSWPDHKRLIGRLADIAEQVRAKGFKRTALILVGEVLAPHWFEDSYLYGAGQGGKV
ncbi:MAG TPA: precorrin-4 C(11)-methyltransferase [Candidatus Competibacteraceae bacterium]|nr:precorrin-4 C(11)-methyltransferase [Candidatus Competibacteraceae bacterium]